MVNLFSNFFKPSPSKEKNRKTIGLLFLVSVLFFFLARLVPIQEAAPLNHQMVLASRTMIKAMEGLKECREKKAIPLSQKDVNNTGMIGKERSSITTTKGHLQAKRTSTNPNFAGLVVYLLKEAGVEEQDPVALGASGSFPSLIVASLSAIKEMEAHPLLICSLGASQWGANIPRFHWLRMHQCLIQKGIFKTPSVGVSLGGSEDMGKDMNPQGRTLLLKDIKESGIPFIHEPDLEKNVEKRMKLYRKEIGSKEIQAFINIGGSFSNLGTDSRILKLNPGLTKISQVPLPSSPRGMIYEMASHDIPVIHLLNMKGLGQRYGLPWDPQPLPSPGEGKIYRLLTEKKGAFLYISLVYVIVVAGLFAFRKKIG